MRAKWSANKPKLRRAEVKAKGLARAMTAGSLSRTARTRAELLFLTGIAKGHDSAAARSLNAYSGGLISIGIWHASV
jgi:hypothetical protein